MTAGVPRTAGIVAYSILAVALLGSRIAGLGHSFWTDEIIAVRDFIRPGPGEILAGPDLSHELFGLLAWATSSLVGESEIALRLWSVLPFLAGVGLLTVWLHRRVGALSGILFLFLATVSPLLLDITRQARGYGLAFLAMSVLVVAGLEACRNGQTSMVVTFCVAGAVGTATLPQFGVAFVASGVALLATPALRRRVALGVAASLLATAAFYAPHLGQVRGASRIEDGVQIDTLWLVTASIDQILLPALIWIDGTALVAGVVWLPATLLAIFVMSRSPLARARTTLLFLCAGPLVTILVLWLAQAYVIPRYLSFLLVPLFVLTATGCAALLSRAPSAIGAVTVAVCIVGIALLGARFAMLTPDVVRLPREANRNAAEVVLTSGTPPADVLAYMRNPDNLGFYLGYAPVELDADGVRRLVCASRRPIAYVTQPFALESVDLPCLERAGVRHHRFEQYARGGELNVWLVPPGLGR